MPALWNSFSACLLARSDRIGRDRLDLLNCGHAIPLGLPALCAMRHALCHLSSVIRHLPSALCHPSSVICSLRNACHSTGVQLFFKQGSHKAPSTHKEGGAFLFCPGKRNFPIVVHSRKQRPCIIGYAVGQGERLTKKERYDLLD